MNLLYSHFTPLGGYWAGWRAGKMPASRKETLKPRFAKCFSRPVTLLFIGGWRFYLPEFDTQKNFYLFRSYAVESVSSKLRYDGGAICQANRTARQLRKSYFCYGIGGKMWKESVTDEYNFSNFENHSAFGVQGWKKRWYRRSLSTMKTSRQES